MKPISLKIPLQPSIAALLTVLSKFASAWEVRYFVIGANARDMLMHHVHGLPVRRASLDVDFGIVVETWEEYQKMLTALLEDASFRAHPKMMQRLYFSSSSNEEVCIDLIPFGGVAAPDQTVAWPPDMRTIMNVAGFDEAINNALSVHIGRETIVPVCSIPGLVITKLMAWLDRGDEDHKDATDFRYILTNYDSAGNLDRLYGEASEVLVACDFDISLAGAQLLGMDVGQIAGDAVRLHVEKILTEPMRIKLRTHMLRGEAERDDREEREAGIDTYLRKFQEGLMSPRA
jgi:predicted nucleotidyltransferase